MSTAQATSTTGTARWSPRALSLLVVGALALALSLVTAYRLRPDQALGLALSAHAARVLLAAAVGAALGAAACLARERGGALLGRELALFGISAGGALGGALASGPAGSALAPLGSVLGAVLGAALMAGLQRLPRLLAPLFGLAYVAAWYACVYGAGFAKGALDETRARLAWWAGDVSHASVLGAAAVALLVVTLVLAAARAAGANRQVFQLCLLGVAIGAAGPIAFVGAFGAGVAALAVPLATAGQRLALSALAGGAALALADAAQRKLLGGYAFATNVVTGFVAMPIVYAALVRAMSAREGRTRRWLSVLDHGFALVLFGFGGYVLYRLAGLIADST